MNAQEIAEKTLETIDRTRQRIENSRDLLRRAKVRQATWQKDSSAFGRAALRAMVGEK